MNTATQPKKHGGVLGLRFPLAVKPKAQAGQNGKGELVRAFYPCRFDVTVLPQIGERKRQSNTTPKHRKCTQPQTVSLEPRRRH